MTYIVSLNFDKVINIFIKYLQTKFCSYNSSFRNFNGYCYIVKKNRQYYENRITYKIINYFLKKIMITKM